MWRSMCDFWGAMINENGIPSLTRAISIIAFLAFLGASFYLMWQGQRWDHYETFAFITGGGGTGAQVVNKYINSKYNTRHSDYLVKSPAGGIVTEVQQKK